MTILCTSRLRVRVRAGALVLAAVREDVRSDAKGAADSDVDEPPHTCRHSLPTQRGMVRVRHRESVSVASVSDGFF